VISVLLVDDQALIRQAFAALLELEPDLSVVGQAADAQTAVQLVELRRPDVVLMDVQLASAEGTAEDGLAATATIMARSPQTRVIVLTTFGRPGYLSRAMEAGAVGFLVKDAPADQLIEGIRRVHRGLRVVDPTLAAASLSIGSSPLTERETEVLAVAADGRSTGAIASAVFLTEGTVRNHLSAAIGKLGAGSRAEAVRIATENGWLN
jgi:two-component system, NarL family, response regulator DesR